MKSLAKKAALSTIFIATTCMTSITWGTEQENTSENKPAKNNEFIKAAREGSYDVMKNILSTSNTYLDRDAALLEAIQKGHSDSVRLLLSRGADIDACNNEGMNALGLAAHEGHKNIVLQLLNRGASINTSDTKGRTALMIALDRDHPETAQVLLDKGAEKINEANQSMGKTLIKAILNGNDALCRTLLDAGVNTQIANEKGRTPLMLAAEQGHAEIVTKLLSAHLANIDKASASGNTALMLAAAEGHTQIVSDLLSTDSANINAIDTDKNSALHIATSKNHSEIMQALLNSGANINATNIHNYTALMIAAGEGHLNAIETLLESNAKIDEKSESGDTALTLAAFKDDYAICCALLKTGANIETDNENGIKAMMLLANQEHDQIMHDLLLKKLTENKNVQASQDNSSLGRVQGGSILLTEDSEQLHK